MEKTELEADVFTWINQVRQDPGTLAISAFVCINTKV